MKDGNKLADCLELLDKGSFFPWLSFTKGLWALDILVQSSKRLQPRRVNEGVSVLGFMQLFFNVMKSLIPLIVPFSALEKIILNYGRLLLLLYILFENKF